ncbi:hypothetical protein CPB83DRAFT_852106 [Crepidotus variabilis]|uniref:Uncharacterized protein n=1 Tax=Crepidotus variabilis TaxID=179855 RepID=A0A9P6JRP1_9AGAR|nr:hypothetical protein CPB83DRAFT_852106 [Crepidotus variabilis]
MLSERSFDNISMDSEHSSTQRVTTLSTIHQSTLHTFSASDERKQTDGSLDNHSSVNTNSSGKENKPIEAYLPISAPIPISHSALGKDAFKSILLAGEEEEKEPEQEMDAHISGTGLARSLSQETARHAVHRTQAHGTDANGQLAQSSVEGDGREPVVQVIIKAATPSTMMALTEPCLLAWCLDFTFDENSAPVPYIPSAPCLQKESSISPQAVGASAASTFTQNVHTVLNSTMTPQIRYTQAMDPEYAHLQRKVNVEAGGRNSWGY